MQRPFSIKTKQLRATALDPVSLGILEAGKGPVDGINARRSRGDGQLPTAVVPGIARIFAFSVEDDRVDPLRCRIRSEEHTPELQSLMRHSYAVFCLKKKTNRKENP